MRGCWNLCRFPVKHYSKNNHCYSFLKWIIVWNWHSNSKLSTQVVIQNLFIVSRKKRNRKLHSIMLEVWFWYDIWHNFLYRGMFRENGQELQILNRKNYPFLWPKTFFRSYQHVLKIKGLKSSFKNCGWVSMDLSLNILLCLDNDSKEK